MAEPNFTDEEKRILRQMITSYTNARIVDAWFASKRKALLVIVGGFASLSVIVASLIEIGNTLL